MSTSDGSPGDPGLLLIGRSKLAEYSRDYHQTVAEGLADWEERVHAVIAVGHPAVAYQRLTE